MSFDPILGPGLVPAETERVPAPHNTELMRLSQRGLSISHASFFFSGCIALWFFVLAFAIKGYDRGLIARGYSNFHSWQPSLRCESPEKSGRGQGLSWWAGYSDAEKRHIAGHTLFISQLISRSAGNVKEEALNLARAIVVESHKAGFDPLLAAAIIQAESTFNHRAVSNRGAYGLMQILPSTGEYISTRNGEDWHGRQRLNDPRYNLRLGIAYFKYLERNFGGNLELALIAYNWGPANLASALKKQTRIPGSPQHYAKKVLHTHAKWRLDLDARMAFYRHADLDSMLS